jgi:2-(1,2-epoxy-1,2-dihydrophenyl)acetyl-CoA isomerase
MAGTCVGSNGSVKALMLSTFNSGLEEQMEFESRLIADRANAADGREGVDAFMAKRKPEFS